MGAKFWWGSLTCFLLLVGLSACNRTTPEQHVERAQAYLDHGDMRSAVIELKSALQKEPNLASARLKLGQTQLALGDYGSAMKELERALDLGSDPAEVMPALLETKLEFGRYQEVLGALEPLAPTPRLDVIRGRALLMSGASAEAATAFRKAVAEDPQRADAYVGLAQIALLSNDPVQAATLLAKAVEGDPHSRRALLAQGDLQSMRGQLDEGLASFKSAAELPGLDLLPELGVVRVLILQNKLDDAGRAVDGVLARAPTHPMANYFKGLIAYQKQDYDTSEKALRAVQQLAPDHPPTLLLLGTVKFRQGQFAEADSQIGRFLTFEPNNVSARRLLAAVRLSNNNPSGAVEALEPVAARLQDAQSLALLGTAYLRSGSRDKATAYLQQAVEISPDVAEIRNQLALSMIAGGETANAIAQLETAVKLDDNVTQSDVMLILLRLKEGNVDEAASAVNALIAKEPKNPVGFNLLGAVSLAKKDQVAAVAAFEKSLAIDPGYSPAALNLAKLAVAKGDTAGARARLNRLLERDPVDVSALDALAQMAAAERDWPAAKDYLERARSAHADAVAPRLALGRLALATNDPELARTVSEETLAIDSENLDALAVHAQALMKLGNGGLAEPDVNKLETLLAKPGTNARSLITLAALQREMGQLDRARENLVRAVSQTPDSTDALIALIRVEAQRGDIAAAKARLGELGKRQVDPAALALLTGEVSNATGDFDAAARMFRPLAKQGNRDATMRLADTLSSGGKNTEAKQTLQDYLSSHPDDFGIEVVLAGLVLKDGNRAVAIGRYQALNAKRADNPVVLNNLAWLYFETNDPRAAEMARRAYGLAPRNPAIADTLGWILLQQQANADEALKYLESAAGARPEDASINYHLATAYEKLNRRTEARRAVERSLKSSDFPERQDADALRARL